MGTWLRSKVKLLFMTCAVVLALPAIALADDLRDGLDTTASETQTKTAGDSTSTGFTNQYWIVANGAGTSPSGCDVLAESDSITATVKLLEGSGYETRPLETYPTGVVDELLYGADLLLLVPRLDEGVREAFLGAMGKRKAHKGDLPVISLSTTLTKEGLPEEGVLSVPWPCAIEDLVGRIEEALSRRHLPHVRNPVDRY